MSVAGDPAMAKVLPRSGPFPQPPHRMTAIDRVMRAAQPDHHFVMPTARARIATATRGACCSNARCSLCPVDAKFTAANGFGHILDDPRVDVLTGAKVVALETAAGQVSGVVFEHGGRAAVARGETVVLGANAIHSPAILLRSGLGGPFVGKGLHEQLGFWMEAYVDGIDNFDGSTITTGLNYGLFDGEFRREAGAALVFFENRFPFGLRPERGKWRQTVPMMVAVEELPDDRNTVELSADGSKPVVTHHGHSDYARRGAERAMAEMSRLLAPLPVERIEFRNWRATESHVQGTLRMGRSPADSVVDRDLVHHTCRNLLVVGTAVFPSCGAANPSLTAAALSLRAAAAYTEGDKV